MLLFGVNMKRQVRLGIDMISHAIASREEHFITATRICGESHGDLFKRAAKAIKGKGARIISQEVFGFPDARDRGRAALETAFGALRWPVTWVEECVDGAATDMAGVQVHAVSGAPVEPVEMDGVVVGTVVDYDDASVCRLGGLLPDDPSSDRSAQTRSVLELMEAALRSAGMDFSRVVRTWFFNRDILSWYGEFNKARDRFFKDRSVYDGLVPASTGVGGRNRAGAALAAGLIAIDPKKETARARAVASPLQCPALEYGSSFSRAVEAELSGVHCLWISGTASIEPEGKTLHVGDADAQVSLTMEVVRAILESRGMGWEDLTRAIAYFKHPEYLTAFIRYCEGQSLPALPVVPVHCDICRDDLLFEIEADAVKKL